MNKILSILLIVLFSSCSLSKVKPEVSIVDVQFSDITFFETTADFIIRIANPNSENLSIDGASHDIYINDIHVGKGLVDQKIIIPRLSSATQNVKIHISNLSLLRDMQNIINTKNFDYRIDSTVFLTGGLGLSNYHLSQSGHFTNPF